MIFEVLDLPIPKIWLGQNIK